MKIEILINTIKKLESTLNPKYDNQCQVADIETIRCVDNCLNCRFYKYDKALKFLNELKTELREKKLKRILND